MDTLTDPTTMLGFGRELRYELAFQRFNFALLPAAPVQVYLRLKGVHKSSRYLNRSCGSIICGQITLL